VNGRCVAASCSALHLTREFKNVDNRQRVRNDPRCQLAALENSHRLPIDYGFSSPEVFMPLPRKSTLEKNVDIVIDTLRRRKRLGRSESTVRYLVTDDLESGMSVQEIIAVRISAYERARNHEHVPKLLRGRAPEPSVPSWRDVITERMQECGLNCGRLGNACGVNRSVLYRFVRGETSLTLDTAEKVCALLHLRLVPAENVGGSSPQGALNRRQNRAPIRPRGVMK
jgi:hypothetical protein